MKSELKNLIITVVPVILAGLDQRSIIVLTTFVFLDIFTGLILTIRIDGFKKISSKTLSFGIIFKLLILLIPFILVWTGKGIEIDLTILAVWSINLLIVSEALSILGNIHSIKTGERTKEIDAVNLIFLKLRKFLLGLLER